LMKNFEVTQEMIADLLATEKSFINCAHPEFIGGERAVDQAMERMEKKGFLNRSVAKDSLSTQGSSPKLTEPEKTVKRCWVCNEPLPDDEEQSNAHINECLAKQMADRERQSKASVTPAVPVKKKSLWSSLFGGGNAEQDDSKSRLPEAEPEPERPPSPARAPSPVAAQPPAQPAVQPAVQPAAQTADNNTSSAKTSSVISSGAVASVYAAGVAKDPNFRIELVCVLIDSYFSIVRKNIKDLIPKCIMCFLINSTAQELHHHLLSTLFKEDEMEKLLEESPEIAARRSMVRQNVEVLEKAAHIISDIRDYSY